MRTEFEQEDGTEYEVKGIVGPIKMQSIYLRLWLGKQVYILDSKEGFKKQEKTRRAFKMILGIVSSV